MSRTVTPDEQHFWYNHCSTTPQAMPGGDDEGRMLAACLWIAKTTPPWDECRRSVHFSVGSVAPNERTIRTWVSTFLETLIPRLQGFDPSRRFLRQDARLPNVTAIVDGTAIPIRNGGQELFGHKGKGITAQMWVDLDGVTLGFTGFTPNSTHDAAAYAKGGEPFPHCRQEYWLADKGYQGCAHAIAQVKSNLGHQIGTDRAEFNRIVGIWRSRVERTFGWIKAKYKVLTASPYERKLTEQLATLVFHYEAVQQAKRVHYDGQFAVKPPTAPADFGGLCSCGLKHGTRGAGMPVIIAAEARQARRKLAVNLAGQDLSVDGRPPKKAAKRLAHKETAPMAKKSGCRAKQWRQ